ncbi:hypothetical protein R1sor_002983 [Riccia sorocarpa]|uniref:Uncharacterized protein n=1 Tax=Riccia sorocarpa TaxID=122646 RepID=A0ABD3H2G2_9MARC
MTVTIPSVLQASSFCSETGIHLSGKDASTSAVYTSLTSHVPSVFHPKNNFGCSELQAKSARNVVQADVVRVAATFEEGIRQFCLKPFGARKALKLGVGHECKQTLECPYLLVMAEPDS